MTKKHYIAIAKSIKVNLSGRVEQRRLDDFLYDLCVMFKKDNSNFDFDRFVAACKGEVK